MTSSLVRLTGTDHDQAFGERANLLSRAVAENRRGIRSLPGYLEYLAGRTVCLTLLAGSGSRWLESLAAAEAEGCAPASTPPAPGASSRCATPWAAAPTPSPSRRTQSTPSGAWAAGSSWSGAGRRRSTGRSSGPWGSRPRTGAFSPRRPPGQAPGARGRGVAVPGTLEGGGLCPRELRGRRVQPFTARAALVVLDALVSMGSPSACCCPRPGSRIPPIPFPWIPTDGRGPSATPSSPGRP
ncbi:MAG: hypothetical protein MZV64_09475 [Ignavibacteriales bacterium]|nr:hypothetical protein [Ignavibacteriales bacterium]